jgi:catechol 2,3-dioxygenase-like lactoylglutathione lyase family enzyme
MTTRLDDSRTGTDPVARWVLILTMAVVVVGVLALVRAGVGGRVHHVAVRVDNQAGLAVQVAALDPAGDRVGLGEAKPGTVATFEEIPDLGARWTLVAAYGGQEVHRETLDRTELADRHWTITIPADATEQLEQAGFE